MRKKTLKQAGIRGIGIYVPERILTNHDLEQMVETSDEWITNRTGIKERHIVSDNLATSDLAVRAAREALTDARITAKEIDLVIVATNSPDMLFPATACLVQNNLEACKAGAFDLQAGCTSFLYALSVASNFIANESLENILVIGAECMSRIINWQERDTCVLFGDGAGAVVMSQVPAGYGILSSQLRSDGAGGPLLNLPAGMARLPATHETVNQKLHYVQMNGREIFKFAVKALAEVCLDVLRSANLTRQDLDYLIPHQANARIIEAAVKRLDLPMENVAVNIDRYGNTSSATIPLALFEALAKGNIADGDNVVLASFGAGLTWGAVAMRWYDYRTKRKGSG